MLMLLSKILVIFALSWPAGYLYRWGGTSMGTLWRDIGCNLVLIGSLIVLNFNDLSLWLGICLFLTFGLQWAALSTYRYFLPKPPDYLWYHYALHGFMIASAALPFAIVTGLWKGYIIRCIVTGIALGVWSHATNVDVQEERGRGWILNCSILLFLI